MRAGSWLAFWGQVAPVAIEVGKALYKQYGGDTTQAIEALRRIPDYGAGFEATRARNDRVMAELKAARRTGPTPPDPNKPEE